MWVHVALDARRGHHILLELKTPGSHLTWMLGTELWSSARVGWALNLGIISLACWSRVLRNQVWETGDDNAEKNRKEGTGWAVSFVFWGTGLSVVGSKGGRIIVDLGYSSQPGRIVMLFTCHCCCHLTIILSSSLSSHHPPLPSFPLSLVSSSWHTVSAEGKYQKGKGHVYRTGRLIWCRVGYISIGIVLGLWIELTLSWEICATARHQDG